MNFMEKIYKYFQIFLNLSFLNYDTYKRTLIKLRKHLYYLHIKHNSFNIDILIKMPPKIMRKLKIFLFM